MDPDILPNMDRLSQLPRDQYGQLPLALVVLGDGGVGKSVLAGQLHDQLVTQGRTVILVPCVRVPRGADLTTRAKVEAALTVAATGVAEPPVLSTAVAGLGLTEPPVLLVDTVDLLLGDESAGAVREALWGLSSACPVIVTCREREWVDFAMGGTGWVAASWPVPRLTPEEILRWGQAYSDAVPGGVSETFLGDLRAVSLRGGFADVLGVPLRLAMTCDLYGPRGQLPEDLTVSALYRSYWSERVARDRHGLRGEAAADQEQAALAVAAAVWGASGTRFVETVGVPADRAGAAGRLIGEGVLRRAGPQVRFFHQTFAEFAVAQYLQRYGTDPDLLRLSSQLAARDSGSWGVTGYLLDRDLTPAQWGRLAAAIPTSMEGVRILLRGALDQEVDEASLTLADLQVRAPRELRQNVTLLHGAGEDLTALACDVATAMLVPPEKGLIKVATTISSLGRRLTPAERAIRLTIALTSLETCSDELSPGVAADIATRLIDAFPQPLTPQDRATLLDIYRVTVPPARLAILTRWLSTPAGAGVAQLFDVATLFPVPPAGVDHAVELLLASWAKDGEWSTWQELLHADLPERWDAAQIRATARIAEHDQTVWEGLLGEALHPTNTRDRVRVNNAAEFIATFAPQRCAESMLRIGLSADRMALDTASSMSLWMCENLDHAGRLRLADLLTEVSHAQPLAAWPTIVRLSLDDVDRQERAFTELHAYLDDPSGDPAVRARVARNVVQGLTKALPADRLPEFLGAARDLLAGKTPRDLAVYAAFVGAATSRSPEARAESTTWIVDGRSSTLATEASNGVAAALQHWDPQEMSSAAAPFLVGLLATRHHNALLVIGKALFDCLSALTWTADLTATVHARLLCGLQAGEEPQANDRLRQILVAAHHLPPADPHRGPTPDQASELFQRYLTTVHTALANPTTTNLGRLPAVWASLHGTLSALILPLLPLEATEQLLERVLTIDSNPISNRGIRSTAGTLVAFTERYPHRWHALERRWDHYPDSTRLALIECLDRGRIPGRQAIAQRLARHPATPDLARTRLLSVAET
jgi:hypothetical protein